MIFEMTKYKLDQSGQGGFALVISLMLLLVMTLMGVLLVMNSMGQSRVTSTSQINQQTFLGSETGVQAAMSYLQTEAAAGRYPVNGGTNITAADLCDYSLDATYPYAHKVSSKTLTSEMGLTGNDATRYANHRFDWIISTAGSATFTGTGAGASIGIGTNYSSAGSQLTRRYRIFSCGELPSTSSDLGSAKTVIETIVSIEL